MATINLKLDLKIGRRPEVMVDDRDKRATPNTKITWKRHDKKDEFKIIDFQPSGAGTAFSAPDFDTDGQSVECTYQPTDSTSDMAFEYTITVRDKYGNTHDTTERDRDGGPTERRPVIRN
jgi:hypothetical protein